MTIKNFSIEDIGKRVIVKEKLSVPKFVVLKSDYGLTFCKKHKKRISLVDRVLTSLYEYPINYFKQFIGSDIPNGQYYFYYFYDNTINNIEYKSIPTNKLSLFKFTNTLNSYYDCKDYNFFNVDTHQVIFDGIIDKKIYELIGTYSINELINKLNPAYKTQYDYNIEDLEFIYLNSKNEVINMYSFNDTSNVRISNDYVSLMIGDIINFFTKNGISDITYNNYYDYEKNYIWLIYGMYTKYISSGKDIKIDRNEILNHKIFNLNKKFTSRMNIQNEELFKLMLNIFSSQKRYNSYLINESDLSKLKSLRNNITEKIEASITIDDEFKTFKEMI